VKKWQIFVLARLFLSSEWSCFLTDIIVYAGAITYPGAQLQMQQQPGSYVQHPGMVQALAGKMQQAVAPAGVQMQTPVAVQGAHVIAVSGQAPQTPAPAPMPHLVHGHLSYPGAGALPLQGPTHLANGMQHPTILSHCPLCCSTAVYPAIGPRILDQLI